MIGRAILTRQGQDHPARIRLKRFTSGERRAFSGKTYPEFAIAHPYRSKQSVRGATRLIVSLQPGADSFWPNDRLGPSIESPGFERCTAPLNVPAVPGRSSVSQRGCTGQPAQSACLFAFCSGNSLRTAICANSHAVPSSPISFSLSPPNLPNKKNLSVSRRIRLRTLR